MGKTALGLGVLVLAGGVFVGVDLTWTPGAVPAFVREYRYDDNGQIRQRRVGSRAELYEREGPGVVSVLQRGVGALSGLVYPGGTEARIERDPDGRIVRLDDATGVTVVEYDKLGRMQHVRSPAGVVRYDYTPWGQLREIALPQAGARIQYRYDLMGNLVEVDDGHGIVRFEHYPLERKTVRTLPNGVRTTFVRDAAGQVLSIRHDGPSGRLLLALRYERDADGRVMSEERETSSGISITSYVFDALQRLVSVQETEGTTEYAYSPLGDRLLERGPASEIRYAYGDGRLLRAGNRELDYDDEGNIVGCGGERPAQYEYNSGRLSQVVRAGRMVRYAYNAIGSRTARSVDGARTQYLLHDLFGPTPQVVAAIDGKQRVTAYYPLPDTRTVQRRSDGTSRYLLEDQLGSTRLIVNDAGRVVARYNYTAFGHPRRVVGTDSTAPMYAGGEWDADAELVFLRARFHDPDLGRFLSPDPAAGVLTRPQSFNRYAYAENDPINRVDRAGTQATPPPPTPPPPPPPPSSSLEDLRRDRWPRQLFAPPPSPVFYDPEPKYADPRPFVPPTYSPPASPFPAAPSATTTLPTRPLQERLGEVGSIFQSSRPWHVLAKDVGLDAINYTSGVSSISAGRFFPRFHRLSPATQWALRGLAVVDAAHDFGQGRYATAGVKAGLAMVRATPVGLGVSAALAVAPVEEYGDLLARGTFAYHNWAAGHIANGDYFSVLSRLEPSALALALSTDAIAEPLVHASKNLASHAASAVEAVIPDPVFARALDNTRNLFFPPGPPGGGATPLVGGVYLDQTARLRGFGAIAAVRFDPDSQALVLVGDKRTRMPPIKMEYLAEAIDSVFRPAEHAPGMTIDPDSNDPHGPIMLVRYFGNTRNTRFGRVMFECDRLLKGYSVGRDNLSGEVVVSNVPGYQSTTELALKAGEAHRGLWSRFWLKPEPIRGQTSKDGLTLVLDPVRIRVHTETMRLRGDKLVPAKGQRDESAEAFAEHFSEHYDEFAAEHSVFAELKAVAQAVALARWLKDQGLHPDWNFVRRFAEPANDTPDTTPAARNTVQQRTGNVLRQIRSFGGVDMLPMLAARHGSVADELTEMLADVRVDPLRTPGQSFELELRGRRGQATALPLGGAATEPTFYFTATPWTESELETFGELGAAPGLALHHSSAHAAVDGELGPGFSLLVPRLEIESVGEPGQVRELRVQGGDQAVKLEHFTLIDDFGLIRERFEQHEVDPALDNRIVFRSASEDSPYRGIYPEKDLYRLVFRAPDKPQALFSLDGRLLALVSEQGQAVYRYSPDGRLSALRFEIGGRVATLGFARDDQGRIDSATLGKASVSFRYAADGTLVGSVFPGREIEFAYKRGRVASVVVDGQEQARAKYDANGRLVGREVAFQVRGPRIERLADGTTKTTFGNGLSLRRDAKGRPLRLSDGHGGSLEFEHGPDGGYRARAHLPSGATVVADRAADGRPMRLVDARGVEIAYRYGADKELAKITVAGEPWMTLDREGRGIRLIRYADGTREKFELNTAGRITSYSVVGPGIAPGQRLTFSYQRQAAIVHHPQFGALSLPTAVPPEVDRQGRLNRARLASGDEMSVAYGSTGRPQRIAVKTARGTTRIEREGQGVVVTSGTGTIARHVFDNQHRLTSLTDNAGQTTRYRYDGVGNLRRITLPGGACRVYEREGATLAVRESWDCGRDRVEVPGT